MHYTNSQMKLDQLIGYFNSKKINLVPPFQRGHVWSLTDRRKLLENMVMGRPIPAIFLYKEAAGSQFEYNILDGKQRLESLILFIGSDRDDLKVDGVKGYFVKKEEKDQVGYEISLETGKVDFQNLPDDVVRAFREYAIPTIEIDLDEDTTLDEIINLFVDINQKGVQVKRFDIVKAIGRGNALLRGVFDLLAQQQKRQKDILYKKKLNAFTRVLGALQSVENGKGTNQKVDRMWERLVEVALFNRMKSHRQPGQVLKAFIKDDAKTDVTALKVSEMKMLNLAFSFLDRAYKETDLVNTRLARDLPHFYTMVTTLMVSDLLKPQGAAPAFVEVRGKLLAFANLLPDDAVVPGEIADDLVAYKKAASRQTTHPGQRRIRQEKLLAILGRL